MRQHWNALSLAAWAVSCLAYGEPPLFGLSELDIVFPRQGETYAVLDPFPVIFAMQDAPPIFSNEFEIEYSILACRTCPGYQSTQAYQSDMSFMYGNQNASFVDHPVPNGTVYFGETTSSFSAGPWLLSWSLAVSFANGTITFTLNQASTTLPAIASGCPEFAALPKHVHAAPRLTPITLLASGKP
ncbi:hypothetical protein GQ53DRAFT_809818 [Thozetella sp. PMI_491]|nr:hypothetical protein GQ53DRAFT_809818 [Thozetella sp. PMI_491]